MVTVRSDKAEVVTPLGGVGELCPDEPPGKVPAPCGRFGDENKAPAASLSAVIGPFPLPILRMTVSAICAPCEYPVTAIIDEGHRAA